MELLLSHEMLVFIAFITSALTAAIGLGGGVMLLAFMPFYMPFAVAIPLHGVVQLASNVSRFAFDLRPIRWDCVPSYAIGAVIGAIGGYFFLGKIPETYLPLGLGIFILILLWTPILKKLGKLLHQLWLVASIQSFFSLFVGTTGLLSPPVLMEKGLTKNEVIVTHAIQMTFMHSVKVAAFMFAGVSLLQHAWLMLGMVIASILGSWAGAKIRHRVPEKQGKWILKGLITLLALKLMLVS